MPSDIIEIPLKIIPAKGINTGRETLGVQIYSAISTTINKMSLKIPQIVLLLFSFKHLFASSNFNSVSSSSFSLLKINY